MKNKQKREILLKFADATLALFLVLILASFFIFKSNRLGIVFCIFFITRFIIILFKLKHPVD